MKRIDTDLPGVCVLEPRVFGDERGFFFEAWNARTFAEIGIEREWVQDNQSRSGRGVLRGLHYQLQVPQAKLIRVLSGAIFDVAVDVRQDSSSAGRWVGVALSADNKRQLFVPEGFAHGFLVLSDTADVAYKCAGSYTPSAERGLRWDDPDVGIQWPMTSLDGRTPIVNDRDAAWPTWSTLPDEDRPPCAF